MVEAKKGEKMNIKKTLLISALTLGLAAPAADAALIMDFYTSANVGIGNQRISDQDASETYSAQSYGAALGLDLPVVRVEAEYNYLNSDDVGLHVGMFNAYLKPFMFPLVKPYMGVGFGSVFGGDFGGVDVKTTNAYQAMVGVSLDLPGTKTAIDVEGRALYAKDIVEMELLNISPDLLQYELRAKLRYVF